MTPTEILIAARAKIEKPECWTKNQYARNADGNRVRPYSREATCWCMLGAIDALDAPNGDYSRVHLREAIEGPYRGRVHKFNDAPTTTHADVLAAFDRAIALSQAQAVQS